MRVGIALTIGAIATGIGKATRAVIDLLFSTSTRNSPTTVTGIAPDGTFDNPVLLTVPDNLVAIGGGRLVTTGVDSSEYDTNQILIDIRTLLDDSYSGVNTDVNYIVTGDSTRYSGYNGMVDYYADRLGRIGVIVNNNAESGQTGENWAENAGSATLNQAIAFTPGTGEDTILEYSFGLNDYSNGTLTEVKAWLKDGVVAYQTAKPDASVILAVPIFTAGTTRNTDLETIYQEISDELGLPLINTLSVTGDVFGDKYYYQDDVHPNEIGSIRLVNYILSWITDLLSNFDDAYFTPTYTAQLAGTVESGLYSAADGTPTVNASWRRLPQVEATEEFILRITHQGNQFSIAFMDSSQVFISTLTSSDVGESYRETVVPANAAYARINVSSDGAAYDLLSDVPTVFSDPPAPTMVIANDGIFTNTWNNTDINGVHLDTALQNYDAGVNKCTCIKANPNSTTNITKSGDASAVLALVSAPAALIAAGLGEVCHGNVYDFDNRAGVGAAFFTISGFTAVNTPHSAFLWMLTNGLSCTLSWNSTAGSEFGSTDAVVFTKVGAENVASVNTTNRLLVLVPAGGRCFAILPQLEVGAISTPMMIGADTATSASRDTDVTTVPVSSVQTVDTFAERVEFTPAETGQVDKYLRSWFIDATHTVDLYINATEVIVHYTDGANTSTTPFAFVHAVDVPMYADIYYDSIADELAVRANTVSGDIDAEVFAVGTFAGMTALPADSFIGSKNGASQAVGTFGNDGAPVDYSSKESAGW